MPSQHETCHVKLSTDVWLRSRSLVHGSVIKSSSCLTACIILFYRYLAQKLCKWITSWTGNCGVLLSHDGSMACKILIIQFLPVSFVSQNRHRRSSLNKSIIAFSPGVGAWTDIELVENPFKLGRVQDFVGQDGRPRAGMGFLGRRHQPPPHQLSSQGGFGAEPWPPKDFPLFSALRMASNLLIVDCHAVIEEGQDPRPLCVRPWFNPMSVHADRWRYR